MTKKIAEFLEEVPDVDFWIDIQGGRPDYPGLFINILKISLADPRTQVVHLKKSQIPNPSSFQRAVAKEAKARRERQGEAA